MVRKQIITFNVVLIIALLWGVLSISAAQAGPLPQDERPPANGGDDSGTGGGGTGGNGGGSGGGISPATCAALKGQVLNWGFGPEPNVGLQLKTGSWQVSTTSASDGNYGFGGLGTGIALLHLSLAPGQAENLQPQVQDAAVYLTCDYPIIANLAVFSGETMTPPATLTMSATGRLTADSRLPVRLTIKNNLPTPISNVIVTNLMPPGLIALDVQAASAQSAEIIPGGADGQLVLVYLNRLASGGKADITLTVTADPAMPAGAILSNSATLFYRESVATQSRLDFIVGQAATAPGEPLTVTAPAAAAETTPTATPEPTTGPTPAATPETAAEAFMPPPGQMPTTGDNFIPPGLLPTTGDNFVPPALLPETGLGLLLPLSGVGLIGLAFGARLLRGINRRH